MTSYVGLPFNININASTFYDPDGDPLTYTASLGTQLGLTNWMMFNAI